MPHTKYLIALLIISSCYGCFSEKSHCLEINNLNNGQINYLIPPNKTHKVRIAIKGDFFCPVKLNKFMDKRLMQPVVEFVNEKTDTAIIEDWYGNELGLQLTPSDCLDSNTKIVVSFFY